jgi:beta-galactosidase
VVTITATAVDSFGTRVPDATQEVRISLSGPGAILAADNGSNTDHESFVLPQHRLDGGRMIVLVRAKEFAGIIRIHATAAGLADGNARITVVHRGSYSPVRAF